MDRSISFRINKVTLRDQKLEKYKALKEGGLIDIKPIKSKKPLPKKNKDDDPLVTWQKEAQIRRYNREHKDAYQVKLTKKAEKYIVEASENSSYIRIKTHSYTVDKVLEIQEIPAENSARVKVKYKSIDVTPFVTLSNADPSEFLVKDIKMTKTSNGWKFCDNY
jgi:hypothetical protein